MEIIKPSSILRVYNKVIDEVKGGEPIILKKSEGKVVMVNCYLSSYLPMYPTIHDRGGLFEYRWQSCGLCRKRLWRARNRLGDAITLVSSMNDVPNQIYRK